MSRTLVQAYAVKDVQTQLFTHPYFLTNDVLAKRSFEKAVQDETTKFNMYPEDYSLYHIGTYDVETGRMIHNDSPKQLCNATSFLSEKE